MCQRRRAAASHPAPFSALDAAQNSAIPQPMKLKPTLATLALTTAIAFLAALAQPLSAATPNTGIITIIPPARANSTPTPTAIALMQPADYVCAIVEITSRQKDPAAQIDDIRQTTKLIAQAIEKTPDLSLHNGPVRFSASEQYLSKLGSFSITTAAKTVVSFVNGVSPTTQTLRVLCKLTAGQNDALTASLTLNNLIAGIRPPAQTDMRIQAISLAVDSPERQREQLLRLIRNSADAMRKTFSATQVTIEGLENPVLVRQVSDTEVELYIDYKLNVTTGQ